MTDVVADEIVYSDPKKKHVYALSSVADVESSGSVEVSPAPPAAGSSGNPFVTHGSLRVAQSGTHLEHHSGRSFFYHSDTGYSGPRLSTEREWRAYLTTRKSQGFSVVQVAIAQGDPLNGKPFVNRPGGVLPFLDGLNMTKLNPPWFQQYAARLAAAGDAGAASEGALLRGMASVSLS